MLPKKMNNINLVVPNNISFPRSFSLNQWFGFSLHLLFTSKIRGKIKVGHDDHQVEMLVAKAVRGLAPAVTGGVDLGDVVKWLGLGWGWGICLYIIGLLRGGCPRGGVSLMFPKVPQSSQTESLGFPSYPLPLGAPPLRTL